MLDYHLINASRSSPSVTPSLARILPSAFGPAVATACLNSEFRRSEPNALKILSEMNL